MKPDVRGARRLLALNTYRLRNASRLTQMEAAQRAGVHWRHWQKVEHGKTNATIATIARVAAALDTGIAELFKPSRSSK